MKRFSFFTYCIWGVAVLAAFVVADDTTTPPPVVIYEELSVFTTPSPPPINIIGIDGLDDDDVTLGTHLTTLTAAATPQKNKQQQIQKHIQDTEHASDDVGDDHEEPESDKPKKNHKSAATSTTTTRSAHKKKNGIHAKHMVCSVVVGSLICYSVNQEDVTFDAAECVVAPIPNSPDGKNYTVCSRSLI